MTILLEVNQLSFSYDNKKPILEDVSFSLKKGNIYCLLGVNGSGKTTLFNCISGFFKSNWASNQDNFKDKILYIQDEMHFYKNLTGNEFVELIFSLKKTPLDREKFTSLLKKLKMEDKKYDRINSYSLGMKQKLVLIIGFLMDYEYILMDEPFAAIDFISAEVVTNFLKELKQDKKAIIVSTHQLDIAHSLADEILFLNNAKIHQTMNHFQTTNELKNYIREHI